MANVAMLGTGLIGHFYTMSLHGKRSRDRVVVAQGRDAAKTEAFAQKWGIPRSTTSLEEAVAAPDVDLVVIGLPNHLHLEAVTAAARAGKGILCTKPLARTAAEAKQMLDVVEKAGVFHGYLEDLVYTPKTLKALQSVREGAIGRVLWARSREAHPGPHSDWFWTKELSGGGAIVDLGCHTIEIGRSFVGKDVRPLEVVCWGATQVHPIDAEDSAIGIVRYATRRRRAVRGGLELPRRHGPARRGLGHRRHDLDQPLAAHRVRDVLRPRLPRLRRREGGDGVGLAFPRGRRGERPSGTTPCSPTCWTASNRSARRPRPSTTATS